MAGKTFKSDTGGLNDVLSGRFSDPAPTPEPARRKEPQVKPTKATEPRPAAPKPTTPPMTTRSWYMPRATADELAAAVEHIRHTVPAVTKADAIEALLRYAVDHRDEVSQTLADSRKS